MKDQFAVTFLQSNVEWEDASRNIETFESMLNDHVKRTDLIVLPEMFTTGFTMNAESQAETMDGPTIQWMQRTAKEMSSAITGSLIIRDNGHFFNRLIYATKNGQIHQYDKRHLFSFAQEDLHFKPGKSRLIVESEGWRICPLVCYDLRFPVWSRNASLTGENRVNEYDLLIYVANWPEARRQPWINLLEARAHENQSFVVGVNRVGVDGNGISYSGDSAVYSPKGERLIAPQPNQVAIETIVLEKKALDDFREKFPVGKDKDVFDIKK